MDRSHGESIPDAVDTCCNQYSGHRENSMLGRFYQRYSKTIVGLVLLSLPLLSVLSLDIRPLNDVETWMPESDTARVRYEQFKRSFGVEEFILIAFDRQQPEAPDAELIEAICVRLERLPEIRNCWSP